MSESNLDFDRRLRKIDYKHHALERGYRLRVEPNGLIVAAPHRPRKNGRIYGLLFVITLFTLFKGAMIAGVGLEGYDARVAMLNGGTIVEQGTAWVLQSDPLATALAEQFISLLP